VYICALDEASQGCYSGLLTFRKWFSQPKLLSGFKSISSRSEDTVINAKKWLWRLDWGIRTSRTHDTCTTKTLRQDYGGLRWRSRNAPFPTSSATDVLNSPKIIINANKRVYYEKITKVSKR